MGVFDLLKRVRFGGRRQHADEPPAARAEPTDEQARKFYRFTDLDSPGFSDRGRGWAAVATGAFCDCMIRIVAREQEADLVVEVDALDVTTLPVISRQNDFEYLNRLVSESRVLHESAAAPAEALVRFRDDVGSVDWFEIGDDQQLGMDGYQLRAAIGDGQGRTHRFSAWSPHGEGSPHFRFLRAIHLVASESVRGWRTLAALDALQPYAGIGQVFRDFGGTPRHVRLAGHVDSESVAALREKLRGLPKDGSVVLDLREFRGLRVAVDAALEWAQEHPEVRVVVPRRWTNEPRLRIPAERTFPDVGTAFGDGR